MIIMPEVRIKLIIDSILDKIKSDYVDASDKTQTFLYRMYNGLTVGNYVFLDQALKIFNRASDDPLTIETRLLFDRERAQLPTIHVTMPASEPVSDGIGMDEGHAVSQFNGDPESATSFTKYLTRGYGSKMELVITGSNQFEVLLIYYTLLSSLVNNNESLDANGFRNPKLYGGGFNINDQITPQPVFYKSIILESFFELVIPNFESISIVTNIEFSSKMYEEAGSDLIINVRQLTTNPSLTLYDVEVSGSGGVQPYTGTGTFTDLEVGPHTFEIEDSEGNTATETFRVESTLTYKPEYELVFGFGDDLTFGFQSEHTGEIIEAELTNIDSYTINKVSEVLPYDIENKTTYIIDIIKTNPSLESKVKFIVGLHDYTELIPDIDFSLGDGRWTYLLGDTTNLNTLYRYDNSLFTVVNYSGGGAWTVSPLVATINLPVLPANAYWNKVTFLKDGWLLISGAATSNNSKYFCKVSALTGTLDNITDLEGTPNAYTMLSGGSSYGINSIYYDYINNYVYLRTYPFFGTLSIIRLDLNNITLSVPLDSYFNFLASPYFNKNYFNPYKQVFVKDAEWDFINNRSGLYINYNYYMVSCCYNRVTNKYIKSGYADYKNLYIFDEFGVVEGSYISVGGGNYPQTFVLTCDHENNVVVGLTSNNLYQITRISDDNKKGFLLTNPEASQVSILDAMYSKYTTDLHIGLSNKFGRIHLIDASDPEGTIQPDFGYLDLPGKCWAMTTNQIL